MNTETVGMEHSATRRRVSWSTKILALTIAGILIWHFYADWTQKSKIEVLNEKLLAIQEDLGQEKVNVSDLQNKLQKKSVTLEKTSGRLQLVDEERKLQLKEIVELQEIIDGLKSTTPEEGSRLLIKRLEKKLAQWASYFKELNKLASQRPDINK
ncbi:MAG: hypothetical protein HRT88_07290 [Lentisphaeraceae bacterium]|nr:hypothetical protein [Lentisphaeraceae bacterium]